MTMNREQVLSLLRQLLAAVGPLAALAIQLGMPEDAANVWVKAVQAILGVGTIIASMVWGNIAHTDEAKVDSVASVPGVKAAVDTAVAAPAIVAMANDPAKPDVVTQA